MNNNSARLEEAEHVSSMVFNNLLFEVLKEMAKKQDTLLAQFKQYSMTLKGKPKKIQRVVPKKKGFKTNQT